MSAIAPPEEACGDKVECGGDGGNCFGRGCFVAVGRGKPTPLSQTLVQEHAVIEPGSRQAELVLGNGRTVKLGEHAQPRLLEVDGAVIKMDEKRLEYREEKEVDRLVFNTLRIPRGGEYSILLSDGTKVFLNAESEMNYPVVFAGGERKVVLKGEAFFEVAEDKARPFVVSTGDFDVRVTGTQFNVRVYPDETPTATLAEGSIRLLKGSTLLTLFPVSRRGWVQRAWR